MNTNNKKTADFISNLENKSSRYWDSQREKSALKVFHDAANTVPAYKDFLKKHKIDHLKIRNYTDFEQVPLTNKNNYLREYPLESLCRGGTLASQLVFTSTSGSTGEPFYFCRNSELDWQYSIIQEKFFKNHKNINRDDSTLVIVCLGMGVWIGGLITYQSIQLMSERGKFPVSLLTPGINKDEIFNALKNIAPKFSQVVLCGYPPFIKDVIDEAPSRGIDLKNIPLRLIFAAESFTEGFREYLRDETGIKNDMLDTMNIYGSADIGAMAFETPLSILTRKIATKNSKIFQGLFSGTTKTPTFAQYIPPFITFEEVEQQIILTGKNAIPLVRYAIGDNGGVMSHEEVESVFATNGISLQMEMKNAGIQNSCTKLPFVYIYERSDFASKLYGATIFPEHIKSGLIIKTLQKMVTGKFSMITQFDKKHSEYLEVNVELKAKVLPSKALEKAVTAALVASLRKHSAEYENNFKQSPERVTPKVIFWSYEHQIYFRPGVKQQWLQKIKK